MSRFTLVDVLYTYAFASILFFLPISKAQEGASPTTSSSFAQSTACGDLLAGTDEDITLNFFPAALTYECLLSVPLNLDVAYRFIDYYNTTIQFQSTLAFLKNPPVGYQQPPIDVQRGLDDIRQNLTSGFYHNQYDFEATLWSLVDRVHDAHVALQAGILSAFTFGSAYDIISLSLDGKTAPQVYLLDDVVQSLDGSWSPSAIKDINGEDAISYLGRFAAANSPGLLELNAEWNQLMYNSVEGIIGLDDGFGWEVTLYPGQGYDDSLNFTLANGTEIPSYWVGIYQNFFQTGPLATGGDFYNLFVLGLLPASYPFNQAVTRDGYDDLDTDVDPLTNWNSVSEAFPDYADVYQADLSLAGGGFLTGYFLNASSTAVLSIPSFDEYGNALATFSDTVADFIKRAKAAGLQKVVIDLQQNQGGTPVLAFDTFKQFFPSIKPFGGSQRRIQPMANLLGDVMNQLWTVVSSNSSYADLANALAADEWVVLNRINAATGQNFTSWTEYSGPIRIDDDTFGLVEQYNLTDRQFDEATLQENSTDSGYWLLDLLMANLPASSSNPWDSKDILLLTDGACSSSCSIFVELMSYQAGVHTVVVGGTPSPGPMQAASGSRGAVEYSASDLDLDFQIAGQVSDAANATLRQNPDTGMVIDYAGITLRHQVRPNDTTPLQFKYIAAECRIWYTFANAFNQSRMWLDAASAIWTDRSLCVTGSQGYTSSSGNTTTLQPPKPALTDNGPTFQGIQTLPNPNFLGNTKLPNLEDGQQTSSFDTFGSCDLSGANPDNYQCPGAANVCVSRVLCKGTTGQCSNGQGVCRASTPVENKTVKRGGIVKPVSKRTTIWTCEPNWDVICRNPQQFRTS